MNAYTAGQPVTLSVNYNDLNVFEPVVGAHYRVVAQSGDELLAFTAVSEGSLGDDGFVLEIPASLNLLDEGVVRAARLIDLTLAADAGVFYRSVEYIIEADAVLVPGVNSFASYGDAVMIGYDIPALNGWNDVDKSTRISAMLFAKRMIGRLCFIDPQTRLILDLADWASVPAEVKDALARAQVVEANEVCGGDPVLDYRRRGIQSITVGESKNFFQSWKAADERTIAAMGISPAAASELKPYLAPQKIRIRRV